MSRKLVVIGGGVIGLSIAWQAARRGFSVSLIERGSIGHEASWASAGILPYVNPRTAGHPLEKLTASSHQLHADWYPTLRAESEIDYEYQVAGTVHFARSKAEKASLVGLEQRCREEEIPFETLTLESLAAELPTLRSLIDGQQVTHAVKLLADAQLRSPRFLQALREACRRRGVQILEQVGEVRLVGTNDSIQAAITKKSGSFFADEFCVASGAWSADLLRPLGISLEFVPIRGQIAYFQLERRPFLPVVYEGGNYIVPRNDGGLLVGSTLEDVGFDRSTTSEAIGVLTRFAGEVVPEIAASKPDRCWAGLRPATFDSFPYIGRVGAFRNLTLAAGHFRAGIHLSPITAVAVCRLLDGVPFEIDLTPFRTTRG